MPQNLLFNTKTVRVMNAVAAGTSNQNGSVVDTQGYEGVMFVASFGALTATQVTGLKAQQGLVSDGSDMADLAGSATGPMGDADGNKTLVLDVFKPMERYVRPVITRSVANAVIDGVVAILYRAKQAPTTQDTTVKASKQVASPAEGTA